MLPGRSTAQAWGHEPGGPVLAAPQVCLFEPHQPGQTGWRPDTLIDITKVWDRRRAAVERMAGREQLREYYTRLARNRANPFQRNSGGQAGGRPAAFLSIFPRTVDELRAMSDLARLAHVELCTDRFAESLDVFTRVYGPTVAGREQGPACPRGFDAYGLHSLEPSRHSTTGAGPVAFRAASGEALERRVRAIEASGVEVIGRVPGDLGRGRAASTI